MLVVIIMYADVVSAQVEIYSNTLATQIKMPFTPEWKCIQLKSALRLQVGEFNKETLIFLLLVLHPTPLTFFFSGFCE